MEANGEALQAQELSAAVVALKMMADLITPRTKLVTAVHVSNMLGCVNPVEDIVRMARKVCQT